MAQNITEVRLLTVPLESDYLHTLYFATASAQTSYFAGKVKKTATGCSYQRKDKMIRFPACMDDILSCNYVMYRNAAHANKWYYAFITDMEYRDEETTWIYIETDVMQTWLFDYEVKPSFVEREHVTDDTVGLHTVPEQLETGDYIINKKNKNNSLLYHNLIVGSTVDLNATDYKDAESFVGGGVYNGVYSGVRYYYVSPDDCDGIIKKLAQAGKSDAITCIFLAPTQFVEYTTPELKLYAEIDRDTNVVRKDWVNFSNLDVETNELVYPDTQNKKPEDLDGYKPKNNKLFTYPYCYMAMTNNNGGTAIYKYELFDDPDAEDLCRFYIYSAITPGMSIKISPRHYNGVEINSYEALNLGKFPICGWTSDVYTNWLTQNGVNIAVSIGSSLLQVGGGIALAATGGGAMAGASSITGGVLGIASTVGEIYAHSLQPPQAEGNINAGDVNFSAGINTFTAYQMTIKAEFAKIIDGYFNMFGYKVNTVKVPNTNHRSSYWYTKTIDANIDGALPQQDLRKIKENYNRGITFWRPDKIGDYTADNAIL